MTNTTTVRCACGYDLSVAPCPFHGMDRATTFRTITMRTGHEWLGYRNGVVVSVYANRSVANAWLEARKVDSVAPVAQALTGGPESFIGTKILVAVA